jgi:hypothetical protein
VTPPPKLRVALCLESFRQPLWVSHTITTLRECGDTEIVLVSTRVGQTGTPPPFWSAVYRSIDERVFSGQTDVLGVRDTRRLLRDVPTSPMRADPARGASADDIRSGSGAPQADVILQLSPGRDIGGQRAPVVSFHYSGQRRWKSESLPIALDPAPLAEATVELLTPDGRRSILGRAYVSKHPFSSHRTEQNILANAPRLLARALRKLRFELAQDLDPVSTPGVGTPGPTSSGKRVRTVARRAALDAMQRAKGRRQWGLAFSFDGLPDRGPLGGAAPTYTTLVPPIERSWADPFPVYEGGRYLVFLEDLSLRTRTAHISVTEHLGGNWTEPVPVLHRDHHLSYPFPFRWEGQWYLMPQSSTTGLDVYRAHDFPRGWELHDQPLRGFEIADATIERIGGQWWLFATVPPIGGTAWDSLYVYYGPTPLGPWTPHRLNPVKVDVRSSRPAGRLFCHEKKWYRPAQDCSVRYGYAIVINRIDHIDRSTYRETAVARWEPDTQRGLIAQHTLNSAGSLSMLDFQVRRSRFDVDGSGPPSKVTPVVSVSE